MVIIAWAASSEPSIDKLEEAFLTPASILGMSKGIPITPVEPTNMFSESQPRRFPVTSAISLAFLSPPSPTQALAFPLFITTALAQPFLYAP